MNAGTRILVVDDEDTCAFLLKANLNMAGYQVDTASSAEEAMRLTLSKYKLVILDVMMGHMSGYDLARRIRSNAETATMPIILCTAKNDEASVLEGFDCDIDDYVRKPFSMREMVSRVKNLLRRCGVVSHIISHEDLTIDTLCHRCYINDEELVLTKTEFELLLLMMKNPGKFFTREQLLESIWAQGSIVLDRTVDVNINRLRRKLGVYEKNIVTKTGSGYGFME